MSRKLSALKREKKSMKGMNMYDDEFILPSVRGVTCIIIPRDRDRLASRAQRCECTLTTTATTTTSTSTSEIRTTETRKRRPKGVAKNGRRLWKDGERKEGRSARLPHLLGTRGPPPPPSPASSWPSSPGRFSTAPKRRGQ